ncbi:MAG: LPP20 family lipoprotein [Pseudomonadota bacterium]
MKHSFFIIIITLSLSACIPPAQVKTRSIVKKPQTIEATGYSTISHFKNHSTSQKKLLAMRAAKLDAYRSLAEEVYGVKIKSNTTVKEMVIENDSYRAYVDAIIRGAHLLTITPKADGIYEAVVSLKVMPECLYQPGNSCTASTANQFNSGYFTNPGYFYPPVNAAYYDCSPNCQNSEIEQSYYYTY